MACCHDIKTGHSIWHTRLAATRTRRCTGWAARHEPTTSGYQKAVQILAAWLLVCTVAYFSTTVRELCAPGVPPPEHVVGGRLVQVVGKLASVGEGQQAHLIEVVDGDDSAISARLLVDVSLLQPFLGVRDSAWHLFGLLKTQEVPGCQVPTLAARTLTPRLHCSHESPAQTKAACTTIPLQPYAQRLPLWPPTAPCHSQHCACTPE